MNAKPGLLSLIVLSVALLFISSSGQGAQVRILDSGSVAAAAGAVSGKVSINVNVATILSVDHFDTTPINAGSCGAGVTRGKGHNPPGDISTGYNGTTHSLEFQAFTPGGSDGILGDDCFIPGYNSSVDLRMSFDFDVHFAAINGALSDYYGVIIGFSTMQGGSPNMAGPGISLRIWPLNGTHVLQSVFFDQGTLVTTGTSIWGGWTTGAWTHVEIDYYASNHTASIFLPGRVLTIAGTWPNSIEGIIGTGVASHHYIGTVPPTMLVHIDNMTSAGPYGGTWTTPQQTLFPIKYAYLTYQLPKTYGGAVHGRVCPCYVNRSATLWTRSTSLPGTGNTLTKLNISAGTAGSLPNAPPYWSFISILNTTTPIASPKLALLEFTGGAALWQNPTPGPSSPFFYDWLPPMLAIVGITIMGGITLSLGLDVFTRKK